MYHIVETIRQSDYAHIRSLLLTLHVVESFVENLSKFLHLGKKIVITKQIIYRSCKNFSYFPFRIRIKFSKLCRQKYK